MVTKRRVGSRSVKYAVNEGGDTVLKPPKKWLKELHGVGGSIAGSMKEWRKQDKRLLPKHHKSTISKRAGRSYRRTGAMVTRGGK